jgi:hypothetical protein
VLPWFLLRCIWSAAVVVQRCWESWNKGTSTRKVAERHGVSVRTVHRWRRVVWERRHELEQTVRRHVGSVPLPAPPAENLKNRRPWSQHILTLLTHYREQAELPPENRARVPYHFVISLK